MIGPQLMTTVSLVTIHWPSVLFVLTSPFNMYHLAESIANSRHTHYIILLPARNMALLTDNLDSKCSINVYT